MTLVAIIPLIVAILGFVMYCASANANIKELGRAMLWCGLMATMIAFTHTTLRLGS